MSWRIFKLDRGFGKVVRLTLDLIMTILLIVYVPVRLLLIALVLLRNQPQSVFFPVDRSKDIIPPNFLDTFN